MNTGAEAVETAIKTAASGATRSRASPRARPRSSSANNFHGRTTTIVGFSQRGSVPRRVRAVHARLRLIPYGDLAALEQAITPNTAGFLVEPIQGEGGVIVPPAGYLRDASDALPRAPRSLDRRRDPDRLRPHRQPLLLRVENVAIPTCLILGKALGGGLYPVSAV